MFSTNLKKDESAQHSPNGRNKEQLKTPSKYDCLDGITSYCLDGIFLHEFYDHSLTWIA